MLSRCAPPSQRVCLHAADTRRRHCGVVLHHDMRAAVQRDLDQVEMPNAGLSRSLGHVRECLDIVEAAAAKVPAGAVDDALARELGGAFRIASAAVLGAAWSSQLAEPLSSVSPPLAATAHHAAIQRINRRAGIRGLPDKVRALSPSPPRVHHRCVATGLQHRRRGAPRPSTRARDPRRDALLQVLDVSGMMEDPPWMEPGEDGPPTFGGSRPGLPEPAMAGTSTEEKAPRPDAADGAVVPRSDDQELVERLEQVQEQLSMPLLYTCAATLCCAAGPLGRGRKVHCCHTLCSAA